LPAPTDAPWNAIRAELERAVPATAFRIWIEPLRPVSLDAPTAVLSAPDRAARWTADRFGRVIQSCVAAVLGPECTVDIVAASTVPAADAAPAPKRAAPRGQVDLDAAPELNPKYTFDQFVIGEGNRLAHAAALAVAELPAHAYNPLFLYGPPGTGKTHLLHSIAHYVAVHGSGLRVRVTTAETFTASFLSSLHGGEIAHFKRAMRDVDVLLVDDVQFLADKAKTEEEFFHTFNALHDTGAQIVVTADRLPRDLDPLEQRLRERFAAGLVADLTQPDFAARLAILRKRAAHADLRAVDTAALETIAGRMTDDVRSLEGALVRVVAYASLAGRPLDAGLAAEVLDRLEPRTAPTPRSISDIQAAIVQHFELTLDELRGTSRAARVSWPRQLAMLLSRELTDATLPAIGREFGGRDHSTVIWACRRADVRLASDQDAANTAEAVRRQIARPRRDRSR